MMLFDLDGVQPLDGDQLTEELDALEAKAPAVTISGTDCYAISDSAARTIAMHLASPEREHMARLANGDVVAPEFMHDDIDDIIDALDADEPSAATELRFLERLKGWLFLRVYNSPLDDQPIPRPYRFQLDSISVRDMLGRRVSNRHGREFKIVDVRYRLDWGRITIELAEIDEFTGTVKPDSGVSGIFNLEGWTLL